MFRSKPKDLPSTQELNQRLVQSLKISPDDLAINRQGKLSPSQQAAYAAMAQGGQRAALIIVPLVLVVCFVVLGVQLGSDPEMRKTFTDNPIIPIAGLGGSLLLYLIMVVYSMIKARGMKPENLKVHNVTGKVKLTSTQLRGMERAIVSASGVATRSIIIKVGRKQIYSTDPMVEQAFVEGGHYCVYFIKMSGIGYFVAAEAV